MSEIPKPNSERGGNEPEKEASSRISSNIRESVAARTDVDLSALAKGFCESLETIRKNGAKYRRIWLIRHFPLIKSEANSDYERRSTSDKSKMPDEELEKLREDDINAPADVTDEKTQNLFRSAIRKLTESSAVTLCVDSSEPVRVRNKMTQEWVRRNVELAGKFHERPVILSVRKDADSWKNAVSSFDQVRTVIGSLLIHPNESILIGNRSLAWAFWLRAGRAYVSAKEAARRFGETGYDFIDFENANPEKIILADAEILRISPDNAESVIGAFMAVATDGKERAAMSEALAAFPLACLQEAVNAGLEKLESASPESYARFLFSLIDGDGEKSADTQKFVFSKLAKLDGAAVRLLEKKWNSKIVEWMTTKNYREFVIKYFGETDEGPSASAWMFSKSFQNKETEGLYDSACQYWKARKKQKRSVDPFVLGGSDNVMRRSWMIIGSEEEGTETRNKAIWKSVIGHAIDAVTTEERKHANFHDRLKRALRNNNLIMLAPVWHGKSMWITEFVKTLSLEGVRVKFFEASELQLNPERLMPGWDLYEEHRASWTIFCFDGIDEIHDETKRREIKDAISTFGQRCVITSRPWEYPEEKDGHFEVKLWPIDFWRFIGNRYWTDAGKEIRDFVRSLRFWDEISWSPLLMACVCLMHEGRGGLPSASEVANRTDLFFEVAKFVLADHSKVSKMQRYSRRDPKTWMEELWKYAFAKAANSEPQNDDDYFDAHLSLLYRRGANGNYEFAHESFYEFFLWYDIAHSNRPAERALEWKNNVIGTGKHPGNMSVWREKKQCLTHAVNLMVKAWNQGGALELASSFVRSDMDDDFWISFFQGLDMLVHLEKNGVPGARELKNAAYGKIRNWNEYETVKKLRNFQIHLKNAWYPEIPETTGYVDALLGKIVENNECYRTVEWLPVIDSLLLNAPDWIERAFDFVIANRNSRFLRLAEQENGHTEKEITDWANGRIAASVVKFFAVEYERLHPMDISNTRLEWILGMGCQLLENIAKHNLRFLPDACSKAMEWIGQFDSEIKNCAVNLLIRAYNLAQYEIKMEPELVRPSSDFLDWKKLIAEIEVVLGTMSVLVEDYQNPDQSINLSRLEEATGQSTEIKETSAFVQMTRIIGKSELQPDKLWKIFSKRWYANSESPLKRQVNLAIARIDPGSKSAVGVKETLTDAGSSGWLRMKERDSILSDAASGRNEWLLERTFDHIQGYRLEY